MERGADAARRASLRPRRGDASRRPACVRECAAPASKPAPQGEREGLSRALDGRFVAPGPGGLAVAAAAATCCRPAAISRPSIRAPSRPAPPRRSASARRAEVVRRHLQDEGDYPRRIVMDLWASPTLRSGGEDIAHALALMGVRPVWDHASTRVTGFEIVPQPLLDRPRSRRDGAHLRRLPRHLSRPDRPPRPAARAVALSTRTTPGTRSPPPAAAARRLPRVFGAAPGRYGAASPSRALDGDWPARDDLGAAYLARPRHRLWRRRRAARGRCSLCRPRARRRRLRPCQRRCRTRHPGRRCRRRRHRRVRGRGARPSAPTPALYSLDTSRPSTPKARTLREDIARLVRGRLDQSALDRCAASPRLARRGRTGPGGRCALRLRRDDGGGCGRGLRCGVRRLCADAAVRRAHRAANPPAARPIRERLAEARRRGLWQQPPQLGRGLIDPDAGEERNAAVSPQRRPLRRGWCPSLAARWRPAMASSSRLHPPGGMLTRGRRAARRGRGAGIRQRPSRHHVARQSADPRPSLGETHHEHCSRRLAGTAFDEEQEVRGRAAPCRRCAAGGARSAASSSICSPLRRRSKEHAMTIRDLRRQDLRRRRRRRARFALAMRSPQSACIVSACQRLPIVAIGLGASAGPRWIGDHLAWPGRLAADGQPCLGARSSPVRLRTAARTPRRHPRRRPELFAALQATAGLDPAEGPTVTGERRPMRAFCPSIADFAPLLAALAVRPLHGDQLSKAARLSERSGERRAAPRLSRAAILIPACRRGTRRGPPRAGRRCGFRRARLRRPAPRRRRLPGAPACAKRLRRRAEDASAPRRGRPGPLLGTGASLHVSGCAKGCARSGGGRSHPRRPAGRHLRRRDRGPARDLRSWRFPLDETICATRAGGRSRATSAMRSSGRPSRERSLSATSRTARRSIAAPSRSSAPRPTSPAFPGRPSASSCA